ARVAAHRGFSDGTTVVRAACVLAPSDRWAPGLEGLILGRATQLVSAELRAPVDGWDAGPIVASGNRFEQRVSGRAGEREIAAVAHTLGFVGADHEVLVCSIACSSPSPSPARACETVLASSG